MSRRQMTELRSKPECIDTATTDAITRGLATDHDRRDSEVRGPTRLTPMTHGTRQTFPKDWRADTLIADDKGMLETSQDNKWIKGALIGIGSFSKVYLGMDKATGLLMAVKEVELFHCSIPNQKRKKAILGALAREIELLKDLKHKNIVQYFYSSLDDNYFNILSEYFPAGSVSTLLRNYGAFEEPLARNFVRQILEGLNYLHVREIIHRHIKGTSILVDNKGGVKISCFGISKGLQENMLMGNGMHRPSPRLDSVFWMAPEVVKQNGHSPKDDIWSVGCLVVDMLTGEHPWSALTPMQALFKIGSSSDSESRPAIPSDLCSKGQAFLQLAFVLHYEQRPSAAELLVQEHR